MKIFGDVEIEVLKETVIQGHEKNLKIVLTQVKELDKAASVYTIYEELIYDGKDPTVTDFHSTHSKKGSDEYFSMLETQYSETEITRKIF